MAATGIAVNRKGWPKRLALGKVNRNFLFLFRVRGTRKGERAIASDGFACAHNNHDGCAHDGGRGLEGGFGRGTMLLCCCAIGGGRVSGARAVRVASQRRGGDAAARNVFGGGRHVIFADDDSHGVPLRAREKRGRLGARRRMHWSHQRPLV